MVTYSSFKTETMHGRLRLRLGIVETHSTFFADGNLPYNNIVSILIFPRKASKAVFALSRNNGFT